MVLMNLAVVPSTYDEFTFYLSIPLKMFTLAAIAPTSGVYGIKGWSVVIALF